MQTVQRCQTQKFSGVIKMSNSSKSFSNSFSLTDEIADVVRERILKGEYEIG